VKWYNKPTIAKRSAISSFFVKPRIASIINSNALLPTSLPPACSISNDTTLASRLNLATPSLSRIPIIDNMIQAAVTANLIVNYCLNKLDT
jgi:hypothetical protein